VFQFTRPTQAEIEREIGIASGFGPLKAEFIALRDGLKARLPSGFAHDRSRVQLGAGRKAFEYAVRESEQWKQFDLGWVRVADSNTAIRVGNFVAVEARSLGLWSLNLSQIVEVVREPFLLGFTYKTTTHHVEEGEERFLLTLDPDSGAVWYELEAASRPHNSLARLGLPVTRMFQHRFARDSQRRMRETAGGNTEEARPGQRS
jgi:uncharacterized protein (UPF0548 family)